MGHNLLRNPSHSDHELAAPLTRHEDEPVVVYPGRPGQ